MKRALVCASLLAGTAAVGLPRAAAYQWPIQPFGVQHPIRGYFGDPRIDRGVRSFHSGVDIVAPAGTAVYPVASGRAYIDPRRPQVVVVFGTREFSYWHIRPTVVSGRWVTAGKTVIGRITERWQHVHFMEWSDGLPINPLRPGGLEPYADHTTPTIDGVSFERNGTPLAPDALAGRVDITVDAYDEPAMPVPPPWDNTRVAPALIQWRLLRSGVVVLPWQTAVDFRGLLPPAAEFDTVYAFGTRENEADWRGRYRFYLARNWDVNELAAGDYQLEVAVSDTAANEARMTVPFSIIDWISLPPG